MMQPDRFFLFKQAWAIAKLSLAHDLDPYRDWGYHISNLAYPFDYEITWDSLDGRTLEIASDMLTGNYMTTINIEAVSLDVPNRSYSITEWRLSSKLHLLDEETVYDMGLYGFECISKEDKFIIAPENSIVDCNEVLERGALYFVRSYYWKLVKNG